MTKAELIKYMEDYEDDDDLIVLWWDSNILEGMINGGGVYDKPTMKIKWEEIVKEVEEHDFQDANNEISEIIHLIIMGE